MANLYALIMAGGSGTRLWPLSRKAAPKQLLPLVGNQSLFRITVERLQPLIPLERVHVVTNAEVAEMLQAREPIVPPQNYVIEPSARDSGPAAALGLAHIAHSDPSATVAILSADHYIGKTDVFRQALATAADVAQSGHIVTLGISPSYAATGFGYVERGAQLETQHALTPYHVIRFKEKPTREVAAQWMADGHHSWNAGMFILNCHTAWHEFVRQTPEFAHALRKMEQVIDTPAYAAALQHAWEAVPRKSLDYLIMEGAEKMAVVPVEMDWADIGTWASVYDISPNDAHGNAISGSHIGVDTQHTLVRSDTSRVIATIGLNRMIVVDTPDALLICPLDRAQEVKAVVEQLNAMRRADVL